MANGQQTPFVRFGRQVIRVATAPFFVSDTATPTNPLAARFRYPPVLPKNLRGRRRRVYVGDNTEQTTTQYQYPLDKRKLVISAFFGNKTPQNTLTPVYKTP